MNAVWSPSGGGGVPTTKLDRQISINRSRIDGVAPAPNTAASDFNVEFSDVFDSLSALSDTVDKRLEPEGSTNAGEVEQHQQVDIACLGGGPPPPPVPPPLPPASGFASSQYSAFSEVKHADTTAL